MLWLWATLGMQHHVSGCNGAESWWLLVSLPVWLHPVPCGFHNRTHRHVSGADPGCCWGTWGFPGGGVGAAVSAQQLLAEEEPPVGLLRGAGVGTQAQGRMEKVCAAEPLEAELALQSLPLHCFLARTGVALACGDVAAYYI